jgi:REP element-mobilizing transposase RayT
MPQYLYRRNLPHWREDDVVYFVTWRLSPEQRELAPTEREVVAEALRHFDRRHYELAAYVVMNDHVHVLVRPMAGHELEDLVHSWKSYSANRLLRAHQRIGVVWQDEYFDRIVRDEKEFEQKFEHILYNPWKRWSELPEYPWVWASEE